MRNNIITVKYNEYSGKFTVKPAVYQWDYGLIMKIYGLELPDVTEWHFGNGEMTVTSIGDATSVSVPDECLEKTGDLRVYYIGHTGESDGETIYNFTIPVLKRPKPSDVEPTPVQQDVITQTIAALQTESSKAETAATSAKASAQKAEEAAASINEEMIEKAVSDYLDDHPVTVTEEDPTVPEWAKQANKPTYTAQEVGAVDINELPTTIDTALAQAKASGEFDGEPGPKGDKGDPGEDGYTPQKGVDYFDGAKGDTGSPGEDGFSPIANVSKSGNTTTITVTDKSGTTTAQVLDGKSGADGAAGSDGFSPTISVSQISGGHNVSITDADGVKSFNVMDGQDGKDGQDGVTPVKGVDYFDGQNGQDGQDGYSPLATVSKSGNETTISITDKTGTTTAKVLDGVSGESGDDGFSPTVSVTQITGGHSVAITDVSGTQSFNVLDGQNGTNGNDGYTPVKGVDYFDGQKGDDGFSPSASVSKSGNQTVITVTDKDGTTTATVTDGQDGNDGAAGNPGVYIGSTPPVDEDVSVWIDTSGDGDVITVEGLNPVIDGVPNTMYICGEVTTITINPPSSGGIIDVTFRSGSTVAVLNLPQTVKMPEGFEIKTNKTYEINIFNGLGAVMEWN